MIINVKRIAPLKLAFKPDAGEAQERLRALWNGDMIDRPCASVKSPKDGATPPPCPQLLAPDFDFRAGVAKFEEWASSVFFGGESMPAISAGWGPDQFSGFLGAELTLRVEEDTSWVTPCIADWNRDGSFTLDPDNRWWKATLEFCRVAAEAGEGKYLVSTLDTHSNLDALSAMRGPAELCMDLIESPEAVARAAESVNTLYKPVYDAVFDAGRMNERGSTSWLDVWCDGRTTAVQCDFSYMISPEHFREFILPSIEYEVSTLDNAIYHLDGAGQIPHLDFLLAIPGLSGIQWVPGDGAAPMPEWVELLKKIQDAGKFVHIPVTPDQVKVLNKELAPNRVFYSVSGCSNETEAQNLLQWLKDNT